MVILIAVIVVIALVKSLSSNTFCQKCGHSYPAKRCPIHDSPFQKSSDPNCW